MWRMTRLTLDARVNNGFLSSSLEQGEALDGRGGFHNGTKGQCGHSGSEPLPISLYGENDGSSGA